jgi:hypothetical protein
MNKNNQSLETISNESYKTSNTNIEKENEYTFGNYAGGGAGLGFLLGTYAGASAFFLGIAAEFFLPPTHMDGLYFTEGFVSALSLPIASPIAGAVIGAAYWAGEKTIKAGVECYNSILKAELPKDYKIEEHSLRMFD